MCVWLWAPDSYMYLFIFESRCSQCFFHASVCTAYSVLHWECMYSQPIMCPALKCLCHIFSLLTTTWFLDRDWRVQASLKTFSPVQGQTKAETSLPNDSGQVYLVFSWVWSMREESIPHSPTSTWKTLGTRLTYTENHMQINIFSTLFCVCADTCSCHWLAHKESLIYFPLRSEPSTVCACAL